MPKETAQKQIERAPVICIMGHIDHGKSTLLDYIRKTNIVDKEAGGITQKISAYEVVHKGKKITFLDTPGHESFAKIRRRGASVADIAVLVVSAEDGVKPQTLDALKSINSAKIPFVIAINKIDKPNANIERTKQSLAENDIYIEDWGGKIPYVPISAKTGEGINDLLDMVLLCAELEELKGDANKSAEGIVLEAHVHKTKGITATLIIKNGTLETGSFVVSEHAFSPVRIIEDFKGDKITSATFSSPIQIVGWTDLPQVGANFSVCSTKKEAEIITKKYIIDKQQNPSVVPIKEFIGAVYVPIIIKADAAGTLDAITHEIKKLETDKIRARIIHRGVGDINENDIKSAMGKADNIIVGFNVKIDPQAQVLREREGIEINLFSIIYELSDYLKEIFETRTPKFDVEESKGKLKVLKFFSKTKDKQVIGGKVVEGSIHVKEIVKIMRRDVEIGRGTLVELQHSKLKVGELEEGKEGGILVDSKIDIAPGDILECFIIVKK